MAPRATFTPENKAEMSGDFPRLKLENGERARIVCIEDPVYAYVHTLRAPEIDKGKAQMHTVKRRDGSEFETFKMGFIGRPLCLGDLGILQDKGVDPKNCPVCKMASEGDMVDTPQRRFAMHIVKYATRTGGFELSTPFSVSVVVWSFTDTIFNKLTDFVSEWGPLAQHDLLLGPCTNKDFQKFDIAIAAKAAWQEDDDRKAHVKMAFKENQTKDLEAFCGRKLGRTLLEDDLEKIRVRWRQANGETITPPVIDYTEGEKQAFTKDMAHLLDEVSTPEPTATDAGESPKPQKTAAQKEAEANTDWQSLLDGL